MAPPKDLREASPALRRTAGAVRPHLRPHRTLIAGGLAAMIAEVVFRLIEPWPIKVVVDRIAEPDATIGTQTLWLLAGMGALVVAAAAGRAVSQYTSTIAFALAGTRAAMSIRSALFEHVQRLSLRQHGSLRSGDLVQRTIGDVGRLQEVAVMAGLPLLGNLLTFTAMLGVMVWLDPVLALGAVVAAAVFVWMSRKRSGAITTAARRTRKVEGDLATQVSETFGALQVVQAFQLEDEVNKSFTASSKKSVTQGVKARRLAAGLERRTDVVVAGATALVLSLGGWRVLSGALSVGDLVVFITYLKSGMKPLRDLAKYTGRIAKAAAAGERVVDLMDTEPEVRDAPGATPAERIEGRVSFHGVHLAYEPDEWALRGIDIDIAPGEHVGLVGPSGGGKSSMAALLLRLIDPTHGTVRLDGTDLRNLTITSLREQVAIVLQDPILFAASVRENIRYGRLDATDDEVAEAARRANAHDFIVAMPEGYDTILSERGASLSGGQRQRISLARALLRNAPVVILDEATSAVDPENEREIRAALRELTAGRTTLIITHDRTALDGCDRIVEVDGGRASEHEPVEGGPVGSR